MVQKPGATPPLYAPPAGKGRCRRGQRREAPTAAAAALEHPQQQQCVQPPHTPWRTRPLLLRPVDVDKVDGVGENARVLQCAGGEEVWVWVGRGGWQGVGACCLLPPHLPTLPHLPQAARSLTPMYCAQAVSAAFCTSAGPFSVIVSASLLNRKPAGVDGWMGRWCSDGQFGDRDVGGALDFAVCCAATAGSWADAQPLQHGQYPPRSARLCPRRKPSHPRARRGRQAARRQRPR